MSGDRSLDEFVPSGGESSTESGDDAESDAGSADADGVVGTDEAATDDASDATDVDATDASDVVTKGESEADDREEEERSAVAPASSTYAWAPSGATCDACGASVQRRWRDEGALVCVDCKSW